MNDTPFYLTRAGRQFYDRTVPELVRQLKRLSDILERLADQREKQAAESDG